MTTLLNALLLRRRIRCALPNKGYLPTCCFPPSPSSPGASPAVLGEVLDALKDAALGRHGPSRSPSPAATGSGAANGTTATSAGSGIGGPGGEPDAETRRNAVRSLVTLCEEIGVGRQQQPSREPGGRQGSHGSGGASGGEGGVDAREGSEGGGGRDDDAREGRSGTAAAAWGPAWLTLADVEGVLATLLASSEDYSVDKRGDVGSWCRVEALAGMERLLRLAARASRGLPLANRRECCCFQ